MADAGKRFVTPPDKYEFHEYRQMERFIGTVRNSGAADQLWRAIKGEAAPYPGARRMSTLDLARGR